ncbi:hypothetical protein N566_28245 [Streptomycetaceae bacterium MP113-05]|nr:hypothetical protein N566_28245 [Streptomycetaceae bacterium MP113-05]
MCAGCSFWGLLRPAAGASGTGSRRLYIVVRPMSASRLRRVSLSMTGTVVGRAGEHGEDASLTLHECAGFRVIGHRERVGRHHRHRRDVVLLERRSPAVA